jgi:hypothetical protein
MFTVNGKEFTSVEEAITHCLIHNLRTGIYKKGLTIQEGALVWENYFGTKVNPYC